jgi:integrase/recombinase XerC
MADIIEFPSPDKLSSNNDLLRARLDAALRRYAPGTRRAYEAGLQHFANWMLRWLPSAPAPVREAIGTPAGTGWWPSIRQLIAAGPLVAGFVVESYMAQGCAGVAPATAALRLASVKWPFRLARKIGLATWEIHVKAPQVLAYRDVRGPGLASIKRMLCVAEKSQNPMIRSRDGLILNLLFTLGLRRSEICGLDVGHFDPAGQRLFVRSKGRGDREPMTVPGHVASLINRYLALRGAPAANEPLLASYDRACKGSGRLNPHDLYRRIRWLARKAGITASVTPHRLRHAAITNALDRTGGDVRRVRPFARHRKAETTLLYDDRRHDVAGEVSTLLAALVSGQVDENDR